MSSSEAGVSSCRQEVVIVLVLLLFVLILRAMKADVEPYAYAFSFLDSETQEARRDWRGNLVIDHGAAVGIAPDIIFSVHPGGSVKAVADAEPFDKVAALSAFRGNAA